jgi:hypothetical protein
MKASSVKRIEGEIVLETAGHPPFLIRQRRTRRGIEGDLNHESAHICSLKTIQEENSNGFL